MLDEQLDILASELGAVADRISKEAALRLDAVIADLRRGEAERELRIERLEKLISERLASVKDGQPGAAGSSVTMDDVAPLIEDLVAAAIEALPRAINGTSVTVEDVTPMISAEVERVVAGLPAAKAGEPGPQGDPGKPGENGTSVTLDDVAPLIAAEVERAVAALPQPQRGEKGEAGAPGRLPIVEAWSDKVHYEGLVVTHAGATWQALRDTGREPPHEDWICLASAGRDGAAGRSPRVRETFDPKVEDYRELDIVALSGAAFIARHDAPGACPGAGWQLIAMQGKTGKPGDRGGVGTRGPAGPAVASMTIDGEGLLTLHNADGSTVECDLYPILSKLDR